MGLLKFITRKKLDASTEAGGQLANDGTNHNLATSKVLAATDKDVITPNNADFSSVRTAPIVKAPRYFNKAEADALRILAKQKKVQADASVSAYKALKNIEDSDTTVHTTHRRYQSKVARTELEKQQANAQLAKDLHSLRPHYAEMHSEVKSAETNAANAINAIKSSYGC
ncbi:hypothetical protein Cri9333_4839 (plasmid) [Crinalium epipsammum PCC 9333]|uniref:Uncharacterized protein n=1 Tax=Crinalium epipsammum PCC 9333 TaxID=1173022 RepID=K9W827_9CYAN|nr:hypothetical protein [Crinalium epipsammum]AFZ15605.1 hypothetical protein Cri9333_4839 [Crinalium epipsammum PCC 9333]